MKTNWTFERNSVSAGYRCQNCDTWIPTYQVEICKCMTKEEVEAEELRYALILGGNQYTIPIKILKRFLEYGRYMNQTSACADILSILEESGFPVSEKLAHNVLYGNLEEALKMLGDN